MSTPLERVGRRLAAELAVEVTIPLLVASGAWWLLLRLTSAPMTGSGLTPIELGAVLAATTALTGWASGRQVYLSGRRSPWTALAWGSALALFALVVVPRLVAGRFETACGDAGGALATTRSVADGARLTVCAIGGVPDNVYLPGVYLRPAWSGDLPVPALIALALLAGLAALGLRDRRLFPTAVAGEVLGALTLAPAAGAKSSIGGAKDGRVIACANATLWGEPCGQLYAATKEFAAGEWCVRCHQVFRPVDRSVRLRVVSLFSADIDVLNGLERVDTVSWPQGEAMPPDARLSAQERWVVLGDVEVPDVLSVAQLLSLVHDQLGSWAQGEREAAALLATERASRIHAWFWQGPTASRLTYARPTAQVTLGLGATRLRDLGLDPGEELTLQLDIGLFPLELRLGFRKSFLDPQRPPAVQNSRQNLWIPVGPPQLPADTAGRWVPRIEGAALRAWLATEQARAEDVPGATTPLPYRWGGEEPAATRRPLDFVRLEGDLRERPSTVPIGSSVSEWRWFEAEHVALLRRDTLVLVDSGR